MSFYPLPNMHALAEFRGYVSKHVSRPYRHGRIQSWLKIKSPLSAAMLRGRRRIILMTACGGPSGDRAGQ